MKQGKHPHIEARKGNPKDGRVKQVGNTVRDTFTSTIQQQQKKVFVVIPHPDLRHASLSLM